MVLRKRQKSNLALTVALFSLLFINSSLCYSDTVVPKLSSGNSSGWILNNMKKESGYWTMYTAESSAETDRFYDFDLFSSITIEVVNMTYNYYTYCATALELSTDGINWNTIATFEHEKSSSEKTFRITTFLPYKKAKLRLIATNAYNNSGTRLISLEITGIPKFIPTPVGKEGGNITSNSFTCRWNSCNNATFYEVDLYRIFPGKKEKVLFEEDFRNQCTELPIIMDSELSTYLPGWSGSCIYFLHKNDKNLKYLKIGNTSATGFIATPPLNLSGNGGEFNLSFNLGSNSKSVASKVDLYINNKLAKSLTVGTTNELPTKSYAFSFTGGTEKCIIKFDKSETKTQAFLLDNITVTQNLDGVETSLPGYPITLEDTLYTVPEVAPNTTYYYTVKASNGYITTHKSEPVSIKTLSAEQITVESDTERTFHNEIIEGDLCIKEGAIVRGRVTVKGEVSYICRFTPGNWQSFSLPFIPRIVGGYINGKRYALRAGYDYLLKCYQNEGFTNAELEGKGYIIKVSPQIDNGEIFFFSDKGITLNETSSIILIEEGYSHLANPYTFSINPQVLVVADNYYCLKGNRYIETTDELLPFQSFIVYKESKTTRALSAISVESETSELPIEENSQIVWTEGSILRIKGLEGYIIIYNSKGEVSYKGDINDDASISLSKGLHIIKTRNSTYKIVI